MDKAAQVENSGQKRLKRKLRAKMVQGKTQDKALKRKRDVTVD
jgi:hypothetical protein